MRMRSRPADDESWLMEGSRGLEDGGQTGFDAQATVAGGGRTIEVVDLVSVDAVLLCRTRAHELHLCAIARRS